MYDDHKELYNELRMTERELEEKMAGEKLEKWFRQILEAELMDVKTAIQKMNRGDFGKCELSGELMPADVLKMMPTLKSKEDLRKMDAFCRFPL